MSLKREALVPVPAAWGIAATAVLLFGVVGTFSAVRLVGKMHRYQTADNVPHSFVAAENHKTAVAKTAQRSTCGDAGALDMEVSTGGEVVVLASTGLGALLGFQLGDVIKVIDGQFFKHAPCLQDARWAGVRRGDTMVRIRLGVASRTKVMESLPDATLEYPNERSDSATRH